jgi:hypothetical protein
VNAAATESFIDDRSKAAPPGRLTRLGLGPLKLSKFLWATDM